MFITKKHIPRRTLLKGFGAAVALPFLDSMVPASTVWAETPAGKTPKRFAFIGFPQKPDNLCFREPLLHRPTLSLGRTLNRNATQKWGDVSARRRTGGAGVDMARNRAGEDRLSRSLLSGTLPRGLR